MCYYRFILIFLFTLPHLIEGTPYELSLNELQNSSHLEGNHVKVRGFIYETKNGEWLLSHEPNLKTCCVGSAAKKDRQIYLIGNFQGSNTRQIITVTGTFQKDPLTQTFQLKDASLIDTTYDIKPLFAILVIGIGILSFKTLRKRSFR